MVDAPGFVIELGTDRSWRRLVRGTHALALAALAAWLVAHGRAGSLGLAHALAAAAVLLPVVAAGTRRQPPPARLQAGSTPGTWRLDGGRPFDEAMSDRIIQDLNDSRIKRRGLSLSGGDPLHPANVPHVLALVKRVRAECPGKDIRCWTGYRLDELSPAQRELVAATQAVERRAHHRTAAWTPRPAISNCPRM